MGIEIPQDVRDAVHAHRKIEAIKLLRAHHDLGLKEAKELVDEYTEKHPQLMDPRAESDGRFTSLLIIAGFAAFVIYMAYRIFS